MICELIDVTVTVSIHAPARGATPCWPRFADPCRFQFTRPRGARRTSRLGLVSVALVSIHAPARGATLSTKKTGRNMGVSIHAPARGATAAAQPEDADELVSIHAPARGATFLFFHTLTSKVRFNSRAREGRDDETEWRGTGRYIVSIHAPARGATRDTRSSCPGPRVSIHAPARGATEDFWRADLCSVVSIHAPARGATVVHLMLVFLCFFREVFAEPAANDVSWRLLSFRFR